MGQCRIRELVRHDGCMKKKVAGVIIELAVACCEETTVLVAGEHKALAPG